jgi:hypothetical protein
MGLVQLETFYDNFGQLCFNTIKWKGGAEKGSGGKSKKSSIGSINEPIKKTEGGTT